MVSSARKASLSFSGPTFLSIVRSNILAIAAVSSLYMVVWLAMPTCDGDGGGGCGEREIM